MPDSMLYELGVEVRCADGATGSLRRVVIDPGSRSATHLVVEPTHRVGMARLVPLDLVEAGGPAVRLRCTAPEFGHLDPAEQPPLLPPGDAGFDYQDVGGLDGFGGNSAPPVFFDAVPIGEVEMTAGDRVLASDGHIGHVSGVVVSPEDRRISHVLIREGHLWRRWEVAIPIADVADLSDGIRLRIKRQQVRDLQHNA